MPAAGSVTLLASYLIVGALVGGLTVIVVLLTRISEALADASDHLGMIPTQLVPLAPAVETLTDALAGLQPE